MSTLITQLQQTAEIIRNDRQRDFYNAKIAAAKDVKVEPLKSVLTKEQLDRISHLHFRPKECYRNAFLVAQALNCEYVEGQMLFYFGIDHAFNKIGNRYFDVTKELVLKENPSECEYISIGEYSWETAWSVFSEENCYTDVFNILYVKSLKDE